MTSAPVSPGATVDSPEEVSPSSSVRALSDHLGPASVLSMEAGGARVRLPSGAVATARLAFSFPYRPAPDDTLLVIGRGDDWYAIGVLQGSGHTSLTFQGGVEIRAAGGALELSGDKGVRLSGAEVGIEADTFRVVAGTVVEKLGSLYQRVANLLQVRARSAETLVDEQSITRAKTASILTEETMSINGKQIHLG